MFVDLEMLCTAITRYSRFEVNGISALLKKRSEETINNGSKERRNFSIDAQRAAYLTNITHSKY